MLEISNYFDKLRFGGDSSDESSFEEKKIEKTAKDHLIVRNTKNLQSKAKEL